MFRLIAINFSQKSLHFSLLSPTSPCVLSEREVTSPSNLKVVGALMGNKFIKFDHKTLLFNNWINSDFIYVNDILDENVEISHNFILNRLNNKFNWITEFTIMKKAIPKQNG